MTVKSFIRFVFCLALLSLIKFTHADEVIKRPFSIETEKETVMAVKPDLGPIEEQDKKFNFDWNQQTTIAANLKQIQSVEKFIASIDDASKLNKYERDALGNLLYKLGTFYSHVARDPNSAIAKLTLAAPFLTSKEAKAWNDSQLAYAYELKYASDLQPTDKEKALYYTNKVLSERYPRTKNKIVAFAYCVKGLIESDEKDYVEAEKHLRTALATYDAASGSKDNQYARTKNRLATTILDQHGRDQEALTMLKQVKKYWIANGQINHDPYAARNLLSLGHAYLKTGNAKAARDEFKTAIAIYKYVYGTNTMLLVKPYQLLAEAYRKLGSIDQASAYDKKASDIISA